jgi:hypothetical protein
MMDEIKVCRVCNRVKVGDEEWSENPSSKVKPDSPGVTTVEACDYCNGEAPPQEQEEVGEVEEQNEVVQVEASEASDEKKLAHNNHQTLVQCKRLMGEALLRFADALRESREKGYYRFYNESWKAYLSDPDIGVDDSRARRLIKLSKVKAVIEQQLGREVNFNEISEGRLCRNILPCIKLNEKIPEIENAEDVEGLLEKARTLGHDDFEAEIADYKTSQGGGGDAPPVEKRIAEGPIQNEDGDTIGRITAVYANDKTHYLKVRIDNAYIIDEKMTLILPQ